MKFFNMLPNQKLILIKTKTKQPPTRSLVAKSVKPSLFKRMFNSISCIVDSLAATIQTDIKPRWVVLCFLATILGNVVLEDIANVCIAKVIGV
jgi:hypothetical protein